MRTITLELVRHGPAHNQLLSPLTQYLALCENQPAVTLQLPVEHNQMLYRLSALAYQMGEKPREFQLRDMAQMLSELLGRIPGLTADMNRVDHGAGDDCATHLRLVLSASELALLPFELALSPIGLPGAGQPLLLQSLAPVTITRETRRVAEQSVTWPDRNKVLFAVASPPKYPSPPAAAHLLALRRALEPWVGTRPAAENGDVDNARLNRHLKVLTDVSLDKIEAACADGSFTHVHILAHGVEYREGYDTRFGLVLHDSAHPMGEADIVSGERLATALRASRKLSSGQLSRPAVVTLASCYGAGVASVTGVGASIAHALHADGIPMVIASQFPLSFGGSVLMVQTLYEGLLAGEDPRRLLIDLRRALHTQFSKEHDWASITAYSSLPPDFESQLADVQIKRARKSIEVALGLADEMIAGTTSRRRSAPEGSASSSFSEANINAAIDRVKDAQKRFELLYKRLPSKRPAIVAVLASSDKRLAALEYEKIKKQYEGLVPEDSLKADVWPLLERAHKRYDEVFRIEVSDYWAVVQYISLSLLLKETGRCDDPTNGDIEKLWTLTEVLSQKDASSTDYTKRAWALGNLIELYLLAPLLPNLHVKHGLTAEECRQTALKFAGELVNWGKQGKKSEDAFEIFSTRRQIVRYRDFFFDLCEKLEGVANDAEGILKIIPPNMPETEEET
jgi:hypothetical protein